jgi:hypothetical protein
MNKWGRWQQNEKDNGDGIGQGYILREREMMDALLLSVDAEQRWMQLPDLYPEEEGIKYVYRAVQAIQCRGHFDAEGSKNT